MASRLVKKTSPLVASMAKRSYSAQAQPQASTVNLSGESLKISKLNNGLLVASLDNLSPISTIGIMIKASSRNENAENLGVAHALRIGAGLATKNHSAFGIVRNIQQTGGSLSCTQSRDVTFYTTQMLRDNIPEGMDVFMNAVSEQIFRPWEVTNFIEPRLKYDLATISPLVKASELLHKAAFRDGGLGYSLFTPEYWIGKHSPEMLKSFVSKNFTTGRAAVVGVGINHDNLRQYAELLTLESGAGSSGSGKYFGGEVRRESGGRLAYVAIAAEAPGASNGKEYLANLLLQRILGTGPQVHRGMGMGQLHKVVRGISDVAISAINYVYSDVGLMGAYIVSDVDAVGKALSDSLAHIRSLSVSEAEVAAAKRNVKMHLQESQMNNLKVAEEIGQFSLAGGIEGITGAKIDAVTVEEVQAAARKFWTGKLSMGAYGNLKTVPYLDTLF